MDTNQDMADKETMESETVARFTKMYSVQCTILPGNEKAVAEKMTKKEASLMRHDMEFFSDLFGSTEEPWGGFLDPESATAIFLAKIMFACVGYVSLMFTVRSIQKF